MTAPQILARGIGIAPPPDPTDVPEGTLCALANCGAPISRGYPVGSITGDATNEFLDTYRGGLHGYVCSDCAALAKAQCPSGDYRMGRAWLVVSGAGAWDPMIARESAEKAGRECWSDLVRRVWRDRQGAECAVLLTTDGKKRTWPLCRAGVVGGRTPILYHNTDGKGAECLIYSGSLILDWGAWVECLDLLERAYSLGFAKRHLADGMLCATAATSVGLRETHRMEREIRAWRGTPEFRAALLIAQKIPGVEAPKPAPPVKARAERPAVVAPAAELALW